jgi:hypothetical protein
VERGVLERRPPTLLYPQGHRAVFGSKEIFMSQDVERYIEGQRAVIRQFSARGLPVATQVSILRKLISERNAAQAEARIRLYARRKPAA